MKDSNGIWSCTGIITAIIVAMTVGALMNGWALSVTWEWFIVPLFGVRSLPIPYAIGIGMIVSFLARENGSTDSDKKKKDAEEIIGSLIASVVLRPLIFVGVAWVVTLFL